MSEVFKIRRMNLKETIEAIKPQNLKILNKDELDELNKRTYGGNIIEDELKITVKCTPPEETKKEEPKNNDSKFYGLDLDSLEKLSITEEDIEDEYTIIYRHNVPVLRKKNEINEQYFEHIF